MPGPPTPISACPLKRLEIRDGISNRLFKSSRPNDIYTLTINGERPIDAETGALVLSIHHGHQQLVYIRLTDLLKASSEARGVVSIDKERQGLYVKIPTRNYAVLAEFEERRDFIVSVCLLKKSGFQISESPILTQSEPTSMSQPVTPSDFAAVSNHMPRLSSITGFSQTPTSPYFDSSRSQPQASFTASPPTPIDQTFSLQPPTLSQYQQHPRMSSLPTFSNPFPSPMDSMVTASQPNSYSAYANKSTEVFYRPRISSPLRHSLSSSEPAQPQPNSNISDDTFRGSAFMLRTHQQTEYDPLAGVIYPPQDTISGAFPRAEPSEVTGSFTSTRSRPRLESRPSAPLTNLPTPSSSQAEKGQSFRELMPQPRRLPFEPLQPRDQAKRKLLEEPVATETPVREPKPNQRGSKRLQKRYTDQGSLNKEPDALTARQESPLMENSPDVSPDVRNQSDVIEEIPCSTCPSDSSPAIQSPLKECAEPLILVTDPETLKELDHVTARFFEQYQADVENGKDAELTAKFYMDQIFVARRDFWYSKLSQLGGICSS